MPTRTKRFTVICLRDEWGLNADQLSMLSDVIEGTHPDLWEYLNPGTILVYFQGGDRARLRADELARKLRQLTEESSLLADSTVGRADGDLIVESDWRGRITSRPIGGAVSAAIENARTGDSE